MFSTLLVDTVIFETPAEVNGEKLKMAANRYTTNNSSKSGVTLILTHASGTHKEHWEPVLENLLPQLQDSSFSIHEIWAFDWQSHGDSAVLNAGIFSRHEYAPTTVDWGNALATFVKAFLMNHRIVCIGHSVGAHALLYSTTCFEDFSLSPYQCFILVEPAMIDEHLYEHHRAERLHAREVAMKFLSRSPSEWESRSAAAEFFQKQQPWRDWDERIRTIYVNKGLRQNSTDDIRSTSVTTKCNKKHEGAMYFEPEVHFLVIEQITKLCRILPFHVLFGENLDFLPQYCQDTVVDQAKGRKVASVAHIPGGGHMIIQQQPDRVADAIYRILTSGAVSRTAVSRL